VQGNDHRGGVSNQRRPTTGRNVDLAAARAQIRAAPTEERVFEIVQRYLNEMPQEHFDALPDDFRTHLIRSADHISRWALYFNRQDLTIPPGHGPRTVLSDMVSLFTCAAHQLAEIATRRVNRLKQ
jgi:hypothetical protein